MPEEHGVLRDTQNAIDNGRNEENSVQLNHGLEKERKREREEEEEEEEDEEPSTSQSFDSLILPWSRRVCHKSEKKKPVRPPDLIIGIIDRSLFLPCELIINIQSSILVFSLHVNVSGNSFQKRLTSDRVGFICLRWREENTVRTRSSHCSKSTPWVNQRLLDAFETFSTIT